MNLVCVICSDLLTPSDDVCSTPCGHIFHFVCLTQWLERSKTCPQCREKTTGCRIHRVYFNFSNNDTITDDTSSLLDRIDKLNYQLLLRDKDNKQYTEKNDTLEKQNVGLRKHVKKIESELQEKESAIHALKEQAKYFKVQCTEVENIKKEAECLRKKVQEYKNIQTLLDGNAEDVQELIAKGRDTTTLETYITVIKKELDVSFEKRRELRNRFKSLQRDFNKVSLEKKFLSNEHEKRKKVEEHLMLCESENISLQNRLSEMQTNVESLKKKLLSNPVTKVDGRDCACTKPGSFPNKKIETVVSDNNLQAKEMHAQGNHKNSGIPNNRDEGNSPYLPVKRSGVLFLNQPSAPIRPPVKTGSSILFKRPRIAQTNTKHKETEADTMTYNGLGGHSKYDRFPISASGTQTKKIKDEATKAKKQKLDTGNNQKLDFLIA